jgi:hypothetical protein
MPKLHYDTSPLWMRTGLRRVTGNPNQHVKDRASQYVKDCDLAVTAMLNWNWKDAAASPGVYSAERLYLEGPRGETEPLSFQTEPFKVYGKRFEFISGIKSLFSLSNRMTKAPCQRSQSHSQPCPGI